MNIQNIVVIIYSIIIPVFSLNEIKPKLCVNCKFFTNSFIMDNKYGRCSLFQITETETKTDIDYFVTGIKRKNRLQFCSIARDYDDMCGKEGKRYINKLHSIMDVFK